MDSVYNLLRESCGLSQQDAADFHGVRLDSVKSWCGERRLAPDNVVNELKHLMQSIIAAGNGYAEEVIQRSGSSGVLMLGVPHDEADARACGFPSMGANMRAIAIAIAQLPDQLQIRLIPRVRGIPAPEMENRKEKDVNAILQAGPNAAFKATMEYLPEGVRASYLVQVEDGDGTLTQSDIELCEDEAEALRWIEKHAIGRKFNGYALKRVDQNGRVIKKPLPSQ